MVKKKKKSNNRIGVITCNIGCMYTWPSNSLMHTYVRTLCKFRSQPLDCNACNCLIIIMIFGNENKRKKHFLITWKHIIINPQ
jgi:hypothetical protein